MPGNVIGNNLDKVPLFVWKRIDVFILMFRDSSGKDEGRTRDKHHQSTQSLLGILYLNNAIFHQSLVDLNEKYDLQRIRKLEQGTRRFSVLWEAPFWLIDSSIFCCALPWQNGQRDSPDLFYEGINPISESCTLINSLPPKTITLEIRILNYEKKKNITVLIVTIVKEYRLIKKMCYPRNP